MKRKPETSESSVSSYSGTKEQHPGKSYMMPLFLGTIGFLVYYGLFSSFDKTRGYVKDEVVRTLAGVWKLAFFAIIMWSVSDAATLKRKRFVSIGAGMAACGAALLLGVEGLPSIRESLTTRLLIEGVEAIGEALICAGLVAYIRVGTAGDDWRYFRQTTALRIGQNSGMVAALLATGLWDFPKRYSMALLAGRIGIAILLIMMFRTTAINDAPHQVINQKKSSVTARRFYIDVIIGTCAYALFYLVVIGPSAVVNQYQASGMMRWALVLNGGFAAASMITIYFLSKNARKYMPAQRAILKFETRAAVGVIVVIAVWMISLWSIARSSTQTSFCILSLICSGGVLGLFSTAAYVLGELSSGLHGKPELRTRQIVSYLGWARSGPFAALVLISFTKLLQKWEVSWWINVTILESAVLIGSAGVVLGVMQKRNVNFKRRE